MKRLTMLLWFGLVILAPLVGAGETIRYAIFPAPPFMIGAETGASAVSGIDVEIVQAIAARLNLQIEFVRCPWLRCLDLLKSGEADILSSAYKKPEREEFMRYFDTPFLDQLPIAFYFKKGAGRVVAKYEDLYQLGTVGILRGASYFERFDNDPQVKKYDVASQDQLFPMLVRERFEVMAGYVPTENYRIVAEGYNGKIEKSTYEYHEPAAVYMAISKKSPLIARFDELNAVNTALFQEGVITRIIDAYYTKYRPE